MCEYTIRITGEHEVLIVSPGIIAMLIDKIRHSHTKELVVDAQELLSQGYTEYIAHVICANMGGGQTHVKNQKVYDLTAKQLQMLEIDRRPCFDGADVIAQQSGVGFSLDTNRDFFFLTKRCDSQFQYVYKDVEGGEIKIRFVYH